MYGFRILVSLGVDTEVVGNMVIGFVYAYRVLILTKLESFDD
jgi:hypothetical protein